MNSTLRLLKPVAFALCLIAFAVTAQAADPARRPTLAIQGYDPVAYFTDGTPAKGNPEFSHFWDDQKYQFLSAANRDRFAADPERYAPNYAGWCAASMARNEQVVPNPEYWVIMNGRLYVFGKPIGPKLFKENPELVKEADANWLRRKKPAN